MRTVKEIAEDVRTLTRVPSVFIYDKLNELADEILEIHEAEKPKIGHCKDCKWWKDSDGAYRRGVRAESQCPINRREVFEGNGYCYLFEPQEDNKGN